MNESYMILWGRAGSRADPVSHPVIELGLLTGVRMPAKSLQETTPLNFYSTK